MWNAWKSLQTEFLSGLKLYFAYPHAVLENVLDFERNLKKN